MAFGETEGMQPESCRSVTESDAEIGKKAVQVTPILLFLTAETSAWTLSGTAVLGSCVFTGEGKNSCFCGKKEPGGPNKFLCFSGKLSR